MTQYNKIQYNTTVCNMKEYGMPQVRIHQHWKQLAYGSNYGKTMLCCWAKINGYPIGIIANNGVILNFYGIYMPLLPLPPHVPSLVFQPHLPMTMRPPRCC